MINSYIALGYKCNHNCICCPLTTFNRLNAPMKYEQVISQIDELFKLDNQVNVTLSGGEPTLYPDFLKVIKYLCDREANITILSNASKCDDKEYVKRIKDHAGDNICNIEYVTAIHSSNAELHDSITGVKGSLNQSLRAIYNLLAEGFHVSIKHIMSGMAYKLMPETFRFLDEQFHPCVKFDLCAMDYAGRCGKNADMLFVSFPELQPYLEETLDIWGDITKQKRSVFVYETPLCAVDPYYWRFFKRVACKNQKYLAPGNNYDIMIDTESQCAPVYKECMNCDVRSICEGVWRSSYEIGSERGAFITPVKAVG